MPVKERQSRKVGWRFFASAALVVVLGASLVRALFVEVYYIPSDSMEPLFSVGDRVAVSRTDYTYGPLRRGDVVVFDGRGSFDPVNSGRGEFVDGVVAVGQFFGVVGSSTVYVKRVIGLPGDRVTCCAADGKLRINGQEITESYLPAGMAPSDVRFDVTVPEGMLWLMGDNRAVSKDSRSLLGAPGGGMVPESKVIGRPFEILWPLNRVGDVPRVQLP